MAVITTIAGIPLYTTVQEAIAWGRANGLSGYHTHSWQGQTGYMGGVNHLQATGLPLNTNAPQTATSPFTTRRSGGSTVSRRVTSGGGGY
tara:strand:- start:35 stop:304 length:270 start_codon:yes stop_codon:yes gene_type:complete